tara:strand:- start:13913 stop:14041 length:129 start_codon:yes stop_codon:yes gene_type:complete
VKTEQVLLKRKNPKTEAAPGDAEEVKTWLKHGDHAVVDYHSS